VGKQDLVGPAHIAALGECLTATHGILETILNVPLDILLTLPVIFCKFLQKSPLKTIPYSYFQVCELSMLLYAS
jgi:hypothetical protein